VIREIGRWGVEVLTAGRFSGRGGLTAFGVGGGLTALGLLGRGFDFVGFSFVNLLALIGGAFK
jgi:hypothetical protein